MKLTLRCVATASIRYECCMCGEETNKWDTQAAAFDEDGDEQGKVCTRCLASRETLIARAHAHAADLRRWADVLATLELDAVIRTPEQHGLSDDWPYLDVDETLQ